MELNSTIALNDYQNTHYNIFKEAIFPFNLNFTIHAASTLLWGGSVN